MVPRSLSESWNGAFKALPVDLGRPAGACCYLRFEESYAERRQNVRRILFQHLPCATIRSNLGRIAILRIAVAAASSRHDPQQRALAQGNFRPRARQLLRRGGLIGVEDEGAERAAPSAGEALC